MAYHHHDEGKPMDLYEDGRLDHDKATRELRSAVGIGDRNTKRDNLVAIQTAALVDIADSLRTLAVESAIAMQSAGHLDLDEVAGIESPSSFAVVDAPEGAVVTLYDGRRGRLTGNSGVSEGSAWVDLTLIATDGTEDEQGARVWADQVASIVPANEPGSVAELAAKVADLHAEVFDDATPPDEPVDEVEVDVPLSDVVDDIDADFDGDRHDAAEDTVAALKERRKAAKKGKA